MLVADDLEGRLSGSATIGADAGEAEAFAEDHVHLLLDVATADVAVNDEAEGGFALWAGIGLDRNVGAALAAGGPGAVYRHGEHGHLGVDVVADGVCYFRAVTDDLDG